MNILIVKLSAIGDVIHTLPSLAALRRCYPDADISWVVEEAAADLLADHPDLNRVLISRRKTWLKELRAGWGILLVGLVVCPWAIAIGLATHGAFFHDSLAGDLFPLEGQL